MTDNVSTIANVVTAIATAVSAIWLVAGNSIRKRLFPPTNVSVNVYGSLVGNAEHLCICSIKGTNASGATLELLGVSANNGYKVGLLEQQPVSEEPFTLHDNVSLFSAFGEARTFKKESLFLMSKGPHLSWYHAKVSLTFTTVTPNRRHFALKDVTVDVVRKPAAS